MNKQDINDFEKAIESLRKYRRYELLSEGDNRDLINAVYVDPIESDGILRLCLKDNTTVLVGRKGTGKSTIFMRMQNELRKANEIMTCYIDVKNIFDKAKQNYTTIQYLGWDNADEVEAYSLQRRFIMDFLNELIEEIKKNYNSVWEKIKSQFRQSKSQKAIIALEAIQNRIKDNNCLQEIELQILQSVKLIDNTGNTAENRIGGKVSASIPESMNPNVGISGSRKTTFNSNIEKAYNRAFARIFEITTIIDEIQNILKELKLKRLFLILDDYSEIDKESLRMFCDLVINQLNNNSNDFIKLKISAYPGRVELGELDRQKIDIRYLDYYQLYVGDKRNNMEKNAIDYTKRIIEKRLEVFTGKPFDFYFDVENEAEESYYEMLFFMSLNVVRHIGLILNYVSEITINKGNKITTVALQEAAKKFYSERLALFFEESKTVQMVYDERIEIFHLKKFLEKIIVREKEIKTAITTDKYKAEIFKAVKKNPYCSHFYILPEFEKYLHTLELNFFVSKYNEMTDKQGNKVSIFALNYGLCLNENIRWGKPDGNRHRTYFIESPFNFNSVVNSAIKEMTRIICSSCGHVFDESELDLLKKYNMNCFQCNGISTVKEEKILNEGERVEIDKIEESGGLLEREQFSFVKIAILESGKVYAIDMAAEMDLSIQKIGWIAKKLIEEHQLLAKDKINGKVQYIITEKAKTLYQ